MEKIKSKIKKQIIKSNKYKKHNNIMINLTNKEYSDLMVLVSEVREYTKNHDVNEYNDLEHVNQMSRLRMRRYAHYILNDLEFNNVELHKIITE